MFCESMFFGFLVDEDKSVSQTDIVWDKQFIFIFLFCTTFLVKKLRYYITNYAELYANKGLIPMDITLTGLKWSVFKIISIWDIDSSSFTRKPLGTLFLLWFVISVFTLLWNLLSDSFFVTWTRLILGWNQTRCH